MVTLMLSKLDLEERRARDARVSTLRHHRALFLMKRSRLPFLVGGGHALRHYTGDVRETKDLDVFVRRSDALGLLEALSTGGYETDLTFPHWLGKARIDDACIDIIYSSGNGVAEVDDEWFTHSVPASVLGLPVRLCPVEEMIWSKAFVMERERYDGADICHLIRARHELIDWGRLLSRFGRHWRVLFSHLILFGFVYPGERASIPEDVIRALCSRLESESEQPVSDARVCLGTLLSREQYLTDVSSWGYTDGRLWPHGLLTAADVEQWTAAIDGREEGDRADCNGR